MTRLATWLAWLAPVAALAPLVLAQCSSNSVSPIPDAGNIGSGSSSGMTGSSSGMTGSSLVVIEPTDGRTTPLVYEGAPSGEGVADRSQGTPPTPVPEGGAPSDPGSVVCNGTPCDVTSGST